MYQESYSLRISQQLATTVLSRLCRNWDTLNRSRNNKREASEILLFLLSSPDTIVAHDLGEGIHLSSAEVLHRARMKINVESEIPTR